MGIDKVGKAELNPELTKIVDISIKLSIVNPSKSELENASTRCVVVYISYSK